MRHIHSNVISNIIYKLCIDTNINLPNDLCCLINDSRGKETNALAKEILSDMLENIEAAQELKIPVCQDTGMVVCFIEVGQEVHIIGDSLEKAINKGVSKAYSKGVLRCSTVSDPIKRVNTGDNTPAIIHTKITDGNKIKITVAPKGFGSENMSAIKMFNPSASIDDIADFVVNTAVLADGKPCPPTVIGVGIGGDFEYSTYLAKKALCRSIQERNSNPFYAELEKIILNKINEKNIGPQGFGGDTSALSVNIETFPTHIAGLPVAVNIGCHVTRHKNITI